MSVLKRISILAAATVAALLLALLPASFAEAASEKALTLMIYMCGSNLESLYGCASADIDEMLLSGVDTRRVNVLVLTGGSKDWQTGQDAGELEIGALRGTQLLRRHSEPNRSMGDPDTLRDFIAWSVENCPAQSYALILWDHGAGPLEGICLDELNEPDRLSINELADWSGLALTDAGIGPDGENRFSLAPDPLQQENLASAQLIVLGLMSDSNNGVYDAQLSEGGAPDPSSANFYVTWMSDAALGPDGVVTAGYDGRSLYIMDDQGRVLAGPVTYRLSDDGRDWYITCTYYDESGRERPRPNTDVMYVCRVNAAGDGLDIVSTEVYDGITDSYTRRIGFSESDFTRFSIVNSGGASRRETPSPSSPARPPAERSTSTTGSSPACGRSHPSPLT